MGTQSGGMPSLPLNGTARDQWSTPLNVSAEPKEEALLATVCTECGTLLPPSSNVVAHMRRHVEYKPYACAHCAHTGYEEEEVRRHASRSHISIGFGPKVSPVKHIPNPDMEERVSGMVEKSKRVAQHSPTDAEDHSATSDSSTGGSVGLGGRVPGDSLKCSLCGGDVPALLGTVFQHLKAHFTFTGYECPFCNFHCLKWPDFLPHLESAHADRAENTIHTSRSLLWFGMTKLAESAFVEGEKPHLPCSFCGDFVPWSVSHLEDHVQKHSGKFPFKCSECQSAFSDSTTAVAHHRLLHKGQFPIFTYSPELSSTFSNRVETIEQAFPVLAVESLEQVDMDIPGGNVAIVVDQTEGVGGGGRKAIVQCLLCNADISRNMSCLIAHAKVHLGYKPLQCDHCSFRHYAMSKIRRHSSRVHPNKAVKVTYNPLPDISRQIKQMKKRCFGVLSSSTYWPTEETTRREKAGGGEMQMMEEEMEEEEEEEEEGEEELGVFSAITCSPDSDIKLEIGSPSPTLQPPSVSKLLEQLMGGKNNETPVSPQSSHESFSATSSVTGPSSLAQMALESYDLNGMGKKLCSLCQQFIANNPSSFDNHACKHLDYKPYHCHYCQYQSYIRGKVTRHIQQVHSGLAIKINHRPLPGIKEKIQQIKARCFPFLTGEGVMEGGGGGRAGGAEGPLEEIKCRLCSTAVLAVEPSMDEHLQTHIQTKYYHCPVCTYQTTYLIRAKQHVHSAHPTNQETRILCCPPEGLKGLHLLRVKCFGAAVWTRAQRHIHAGQEGMEEVPLPVCTGEEEDSMEDDPLPDNYNNHHNSLNHNSMNISNTSSDGNARITCNVCKALVSNQSTTISSHVRNHLSDYKPGCFSYQCAYCVWKSGTEAEVKQHIMGTHRSVPLKVLYNPERTELSRMQELCFPELKGLAFPDPPFNPSDTPLSYAGTTGPGSTLLKKLVCNLCKNTIADNPKSVGIHVKNHLNYKPYRCPFCKYMSCEQSKARRHVEHVHSVSGDMVEIHAEENIKERIQEMKARCFPSLVSDSSYNTADSPDETSQHSTNEEFRCQMCNESVPSEGAVDNHVRSHMGKPYKCTYCTSRFWTEDKARAHVEAVHPNAPPGAASLRMDNLDNQDCNYNSVRLKCFPELPFANGEEVDKPDSGVASYLDTVMLGVGGGKARAATAEGKLICKVCDQWVSCNPNSLEVHAKTHLNFKQHQCGYCNYRSCISGKVKRHLDNVHRGQDVKMLSLTALPSGIKQIVADMRSACFPQIEGDHMSRTKAEVNRLVETLKTRLIEDLQEMGDGNELESAEASAALAAASSVSGPVINHGNTNVSFPRPGSETPLGMLSTSYDENSIDELMDTSSNRDAETPSDPGVGKLHCQLCGTYVADNPSSLGLHVRNHLAYKPFSCNLCDYKSCIQAKVKRHLRNVHKCPTDEMTYAPEPDIRLKVMDMKLKCFPKIVEAAESAVGSYDPSYITQQQQQQQLPPPPPVAAEPPRPPSSVKSMNHILDTMLGGDGSGASLLAAMSAMTGGNLPQQPPVVPKLPPSLVDCRLCGSAVADSSSSKREHLSVHSNESEWHCSECGFSSFIEDNVKTHAEEKHMESCAQPVRFGTRSGSLSEEEWGRLGEQCFPPPDNNHQQMRGEGEGEVMEGEELMEDMGDEEEEEEDPLSAEFTTSAQSSRKGQSNSDGPRYICQLCGQAVSMYASSLYVHVKNHMNYKPYCCRHCEYRSPVKSKVRRHIQNAHRHLPLFIDYFPTPGIDHEVLRMKKKCFPDVTSFATLTNDKVPCLVCKTDVADTPLSKSVHAKNHLDSKPYHCGYCVYRSCLKGETRRHVSRQHTGKAMRILFREEEVVERHKVESMMEQCFPDSAPTFHSPSVSPTPLCSSPLPPNPHPHSPTPSPNPPASERIKLGPAFREWYCPYCPFSATSKYNVKEHCISEHPGEQVHVANVNFRVR